ncbi:MAG: hypothetical protein M1835_006410 [Candelina submexicana]|nr:MAG: hypothetical protein M1835_006410 [Candelina submexicana]
MSPAAPNHSSVSLRVVTQYLSTTSVERLPATISPLLNTLSNCRDVLSNSHNHLAKGRSETPVLVHRFKTQVSTLLQGRTVTERWAAVVLIKATVEVGGWEVLSGSGNWVRGLLGILGKPAPPTTKKLCIITLTKILLLTQEHQTLVRELTTPSLPTFINSCINLITVKESSSGARQLNTSSPHLCIILESFNRLLPHHPSLFRPSRAEIRTLLLPLIAPTPSTSPTGRDGTSAQGLSGESAAQVHHGARSLYVRLHYCAPRNTSAEEWKHAFETLIKNTHLIADQVFRAVIENWEPTSDILSHRADSRTFGEVVGDSIDLVHLPAWSGISAGVERFIGVLDLLETFLTLPSSSSVSMRADYVMDLLARIYSLTVPPDNEGWQAGVGTNPEIGREEREALWSRIPDVHVAAMGLLLAIIRRLDKAFVPMAQGSLEQVVWVFKAEHWSPSIRTSTYTVLRELLKLIGPSLPKSVLLSRVIQSCCEDLLPSPTSTEQAASSKETNSAQNSISFANADSYLKSSAGSPKQHRRGLPGLVAAASHLLPHFLTDLPVNFLSFPLRSQIDRTAILVQHDEAMLASVLNPPPVKKGGKVVSSILPFLARSNHNHVATESILRPRMPIIKCRSILGIDIESDTEDDEDEDNRDRPIEARPYRSTTNELSAPAEPTSTEIVPSALEVNHYPRSPVATETQFLQATIALPNSSKRDHDTFIAISDRSQLASTSESLPTKRLRANSLNSPTSAVEEAMQDVPPMIEPDSLTTTAHSDVALETANQRSVPPPVPAGTPFAGDAEEDSDDDMEIPPLTMDPDTEDEDEIDGTEGS